MDITQEQRVIRNRAEKLLNRYNYYKHKSRRYALADADNPASLFIRECNHLIELIEEEDAKRYGYVLRERYEKEDNNISKAMRHLSCSRRQYNRELDMALFIFGESMNEEYLYQLMDDFKEYEKEED